jgi:hypothetical protein
MNKHQVMDGEEEVERRLRRSIPDEEWSAAARTGGDDQLNGAEEWMDVLIVVVTV